MAHVKTLHSIRNGRNPKSQQLNENMATIQIGSLKCFSHKCYSSAGSLENIFGRSIICTVSLTTNAIRYPC